MQVSSGWRTASMVAGALLIGSVLGPPLAQAVSASLVRLEGAHSTNVAAVSPTGRLSVNAGLPATPDGQLKVALASPADAVVVFSRTQSCAARGIYAVPHGKALIITGVDFYTAARTLGDPHQLALEFGPAATPCTDVAAGAVVTENAVSQNQVFEPGIPIPAGDALGLTNTNDNGTAEIYGYLVPAAAIPANALKNVRARALGGLTTLTPPH